MPGSTPSTRLPAASVLALGANHRTATASQLGELTRAADRLKGGLVDLRATDMPVRELVILATCNRVEVYAVADDAAADAAAHALRGLLFAPALGVAGGEGPYELRGMDAVRHLCRVTAGLDSLVIGEHQIAGQVARAFREVVCRNGGGSGLERLAALARKAARRVRSETDLGRYPASMSSVAVDLARERLGDLTARRALVVGAGKAGLLVCKALKANGVGSLTVVNRSPARAHEVVGELGGVAASLAELPDLLTAAALVVTATGADGVIIDAAVARSALAKRDTRSGALLMLDLALPRDVDPAVGELAGIELLTLEDLKRRVDQHLSRRRDEVGPAEKVVDEVVQDFIRQEGAPDIEGLIGEIRRSIEDVRSLEVRRWLDARERAGPPSREELDQLTRSIVNKVLHDPMLRLRSAPLGNGHGEALFRFAGELLGVEVEPDAAEPPSTG